MGEATPPAGRLPTPRGARATPGRRAPPSKIGRGVWIERTDYEMYVKGFFRLFPGNRCAWNTVRTIRQATRVTLTANWSKCRPR